MSARKDTDEGLPCKICGEIIFMLDHPVHFKCYSARETSLVNIIHSLQGQVNAMKESFKAIEAVFKSFEAALKLGNECDVQPVAPKRQVRQTTKEKSVEAEKNRSKKKKLQSISPLAISNGTSSPTQLNVSTNNRNITATTVLPLMPLPTATPSSSTIEEAIDIVNDNIPGNVAVDESEGNQNTYADVLSKEPSSNGAVPLLKCIPPPRSIFLSGFDPELTERDLKDYARYNLNSTIELNIRKMNFREPKPYASFVIDAGRDIDLFHSLCDPRFWPEHAIVHEYEFFHKPRARVPSTNRRKYLPSQE